MDCQHVHQLLPRLGDDRLAQDEAALVRAHLEGCRGCASEARAAERTDRVLAAALSDHPFGDAAVERLLLDLPIRAQAERMRTRARPRGPGLGLGAAAAAVLLVAGGLLLLPARPTATGERELAEAPVLGKATGVMRKAAPGGAGFDPLPAGSEVRAGELLVAIETPARIELPDGTRVDLHADTELSLQRDADGGVTVALGAAGGEVLCDVARRSAPFRVRARGVEAEVLGTRFLVHQGANVSRVVVHRGAVRVSGHGASRRLGPDEAAEARPDVPGLELLKVTALQHGLWHPLVREEARAAAERPVPTPGPSAPPAPVGTSTPPPAGPVDPGLDVPVIPPRGGDGTLPGG